MNDKKTQEAVPNSSGYSAANPFGMFAQTWKHEAQQAMTQAMGQTERFFSEYEKGMHEMSKLALVQMKMSQEANRTFMDGLKAMMR